MNELALFAGAGGGILGGILLGWTTVCAVEINNYCRKILLQRQADGCLDSFPVWSDVRKFDGRDWANRVDIITAGFPCQPFSVAGKQRGEADERNLWPETIRIIREVGPRFALLENVPGLLAHEYFGTILGELAEAGYDAEWTVLGADDCGAPHIRKRLWILAYADEPRLEGRELLSKRASELTAGQGRVAHAERSRQLQPQGGFRTQRRWLGNSSWWSVEPDVGRVAHGVADRVDRLRALGNGQVPLVAAAAWTELMRRVIKR